MKTLVAEDDFTSRELLKKILSPYGPCDTAVDGKEAIEAFRSAWGENEPYDLICLDIMMPEMDGQQVLKGIRSFEDEKGVDGPGGVKVIMTTALADRHSVVKSIQGKCNAYLIKPIYKRSLIDKIKEIGLIEEEVD